MGRFFIWLSGADRNILAKCTSLSRSERIRFGGIGALVLVPAVLGMFSMMYAISTVNQNTAVYVTAGVAWSLIVVAIDRYLVSTIHKSAFHKGPGRSLGIAARMVLAVFVGIAVSHPIVLLFFRDTITQELAQQEREEIRLITAEADAERNALLTAPKPDATPLTLPQSVSITAKEMTDKLELSKCLGQLQTAEQSGREIELPCGYSSPYVTCADRCIAIGEQKRQVDAEIATLRNRAGEETRGQLDRLDAENKRRQEVAAAEEKRRQDQIAAIDRAAEQDVGKAQAGFSRDYLARVKALARIEEREPQVAAVKWFMILFFIVVDILPVTMKLSTPAGEYESVRDTLLAKTTARQLAEQEVAKATGPALIDIRANHNIVAEDAAAITAVAVDFARKVAEDGAEFEGVMHEILQGGGTNGSARAAAEEVEGLRRARRAAVREATARITDHFHAGNGG